MIITFARSSIASSHLITDQGNIQKDEVTEVAKNRWKKSGCHLTMNTATYNIRSIATEERLEKFEHEINVIN